MKSALAVVCASAFLLTGMAGVAKAEKKRVVVEQFTGPGSDQFREVVLGALKGSADVVADKKVSQVEADLGLIQVSESYGAAGRELKAEAFVKGTVTAGKKHRAKLIVRSGDGTVVGEENWADANGKKLVAAVGADVGPKLTALLERTKAASGGKAVASAGSKGDEGGSPRKKRASSSSSEESGADAEAKASDASEPAAGDLPTGLSIAVGVRFFSRNFDYNDKLSNLQKYDSPASPLPAMPAPGLAVEYFPVGFFGVNASFNYAVNAGAKDQEGSVFRTKAYSYLVGAKGRLPVGPLQVEPSLSYGTHAFIVEDTFSTKRLSLAGVDYNHLRIGSGARVPFGGGAAFDAGLYYLYVTSAGEILDGKKYFYGSVKGMEMSAGVTMPLTSSLDARVSADLRRLAFAFDAKTSALKAGGAVDQYIGLNLAVAYNLGR